MPVKTSILQQPNEQHYTIHSLRISVVIQSSATVILDLMQKQSIQVNRSPSANFILPVIHRSIQNTFFLQCFSKLEEIFWSFPAPQVNALAQMWATSSSPPRTYAPALFISLVPLCSLFLSSVVAQFINDKYSGTVIKMKAPNMDIAFFNLSVFGVDTLTIGL